MENKAFDGAAENHGDLRKRKLEDQPDRKSDAGSVGTPSVIIEGTVRMKKSVGLISGISLIVGTIIGSGIFISPKGVLEGTGSVGLSLTVWAGAGVLALLGSLSYSELGTMIRKSGGEYVYIKQALGDIPAFLFAWTSVIVIRTSSMAIISLTFGEYMGTFFTYCGNPQIPIKLVAAMAIFTLSIVNSWDTRLAANIQIFFTATKLLALIIISVGGIVRLAQGHTSELQTGYSGSTTDPSTIALAFYDALWAYDGWNNLNLVTEEIENPRRNLPLANILGVLIVTVVYIFTNISYLTAMTSAELLASNAVAVTWGETVLGVAAIIMPISVLFSTFGAANGTLFSGGRVVYVAGREGHLPEILSYVHVNRLTPVPSIIFTAIISIAMVIPGNLSSLVDFFSFTAWMFYGMTVLSLLVLRFRMKDAERPIKVPFPIPVIFFVLAVYLVIAPIVQDPRIEFLYAFLFIIGGLFFYFPFVYFKIRIPGLRAVTHGLQKFMEVVPSPYIPEE